MKKFLLYLFIYLFLTNIYCFKEITSDELNFQINNLPESLLVSVTSLDSLIIYVLSNETQYLENTNCNNIIFYFSNNNLNKLSANHRKSIFNYLNHNHIDFHLTSNRIQSTHDDCEKFVYIDIFSWTMNSTKLDTFVSISINSSFVNKHGFRNNVKMKNNMLYLTDKAYYYF
jgi:hypothetical protein